MAVLDTGGETFSGLASGGSGHFFTPAATIQKRIRIVDSCGDVFSDPGATPGASTNLFQLIQSVGAPFPAPPMLEAHSSEWRLHESAALPGPPRHSSANAGHFVAPFPAHPGCLHDSWHARTDGGPNGRGSPNHPPQPRPTAATLIVTTVAQPNAVRRREWQGTGGMAADEECHELRVSFPFVGSIAIRIDGYRSVSSSASTLCRRRARPRGTGAPNPLQSAIPRLQIDDVSGAHQTRNVSMSAVSAAGCWRRLG